MVIIGGTVKYATIITVLFKSASFKRAFTKSSFRMKIAKVAISTTTSVFQFSTTYVDTDKWQN